MAVVRGIGTRLCRLSGDDTGGSPNGKDLVAFVHANGRRDGRFVGQWLLS